MKAVAAPAHKEVTAAMDNKEADMVTWDMVDGKVVNKDTVNMVNRNMEDTVDKAIEDSKADGDSKVGKVMVNNVVMDKKDTEVVMDNKADKDTEDNKVVGGNKRIMANSEDQENCSTVGMDSNMRASTVKTATMAEEDMVTMKMNPGCRHVTRVGKKKIMMTILMKMKTIMECRAGMKKTTKMNMIRKTAAGEPLWDIHVVDLAACPMSRNIAWVAKIGMPSVMTWEGRAGQAVLLNMDQRMDLMVPHLRAGVLADQAVVATTLPVAVPPVCGAAWAGNHRMGAMVAVAGAAALIRAVHRNTEAVVH